jgi:chaperonin GroEL
LQQLIEETSGNDQEWHCRRLAQFTRGVVRFEVLGKSLQETEQLEGRSCGALHAGRAAVALGCVPGGGVVYLRGASDLLEGAASLALRWALEEPVRSLLAGSGLEVSNTLDSLRANESLGLDVVRCELPLWRSEGPLDPTRIVRTVIECALESALRAYSRFDV